MKTCGTCRHWLPPDNNYGEVPGTGKCQAVVQFWDATEWEAAMPGGRVLRPEYKGRKAFVQDSSDCYAELKTFADFGCTQHEPAAGPGRGAPLALGQSLIP